MKTLKRNIYILDAIGMSTNWTRLHSFASQFISAIQFSIYLDGIKDNIVDLIIRIFVSQFVHPPNSLIFLVNIN